MKTLYLSWQRAAKIWWSFIWRVAVIGAGLSILLGFGFGIVAGSMGLDESTFRLISNIIGFVVAIPVGIWAMWVALNKRYSDFGITLYAPDAEETPEPVSGHQDRGEPPRAAA